MCFFVVVVKGKVMLSSLKVLNWKKIKREGQIKLVNIESRRNKEYGKAYENFTLCGQSWLKFDRFVYKFLIIMLVIK